MASAVSLLKGGNKTMRRKEKRARIEQIRVILGLSDSQRTPMVMLSLNIFVYFSVVFGFVRSVVPSHTD
jgi:hypothetical protein